MFVFKDIDEMLGSLGYIGEIYNIYRVVNPFSKEIIMARGSEGLIPIDGPCYGVWNTGRICDNCISVRAVNEKKIVLKMGSKDRSLYIVTAIPIDLNGERLVLELIQDVTDGLYMESDEAYGEIHKLTHQLSLKFDDLIAKDELTGLYNRRYIEERLPADMAAACRDDSPLSVIFADLDRFKKVNDTYGHIAGDAVLKQFAALLYENVRRDQAWVARYGGEEFLICLPEVAKADALKIAERLRQQVSGNPFNVGNIHLSMTCSFGVYTADKGLCNDMTTLIQRADTNLYKAKKAGRNRVYG